MGDEDILTLSQARPAPSLAALVRALRDGSPVGTGFLSSRALRKLLLDLPSLSGGSGGRTEVDRERHKA